MVGWSRGILDEAVGFLFGRREVKQNGVFIVGHSLGGAVAFYVAEKDKRVKGVVLWAVPHDHAYNIRRFVIRTRGWLG